MREGTPRLRSPLLASGRYYLLAGAAHAALLFLTDLHVVRITFLKLAWNLGPYRSFPIPYDYSDWYRPNTSAEFAPIVGTLIAMVLGLAVVVAVLHATVFGLTVAAHARLGRPRYWKDVRPRLNLAQAWITSAARSWWIWPLGQVVWILIDQLYWGFQYGLFPVIQNSAPYSAANLLVIAIGFSIKTSNVLRDAVIQSLRPEELRCHRCGYPLRGIESARCPECGTERDRPGLPRYGLRRARGGRLSLRTTTVRALLVTAALLAPVWIPMLLLNVPRSWLAYVPEWLGPKWQAVSRNLNAFPIRLDAVCVIRRGTEIATLALTKDAPSRARYEVNYWMDATRFPMSAADVSASGIVTNGGGPFIQIGPWAFSYGMASEDMLWLTRPDESYGVTAFEASTFEQLNRR